MSNSAMQVFPSEGLYSAQKHSSLSVVTKAADASGGVLYVTCLIVNRDQNRVVMMRLMLIPLNQDHQAV